MNISDQKPVCVLPHIWGFPLLPCHIWDLGLTGGATAISFSLPKRGNTALAIPDLQTFLCLLSEEPSILHPPKTASSRKLHPLPCSFTIGLYGPLNSSLMTSNRKTNTSRRRKAFNLPFLPRGENCVHSILLALQERNEKPKTVKFPSSHPMQLPSHSRSSLKVC